MTTLLRPRLFVALLMFSGISVLAADEQPELRAPWAGAAVITQGNRSTCSHNTATFRTCIDNSDLWENTYALDIVQRVNGVPQQFNVLAPADGTVAGFIDDPVQRVGGRQLWVNVVGPTGKNFQIVLMHLSEIKANYKMIGAAVHRGDVIAVSGNTTSTTAKPGIHLHMHLWAGTGSRDSHTQPIERLRLIAAKETTVRIYESKGDSSDDPLKMSLNDDSVAGKTFTSDNVPSASPSRDLLTNGSFETIKVPTNSAPDGSWKRTFFSGGDFNTLIGGGGWGHNGTAAYAYLGGRNSSSEVIESAPFVVPTSATAADLQFWVSIVTEERTTTTPYDKLTLSLVDARSGAVIASLGYISNLSATGAPTAYAVRQWPVGLTAVSGRTLRLRLSATCDGSLPTTWRVDDLSLVVR